MSDQSNNVQDLHFDLADRMRKSLRYAGIGVGDMADYLGVGRNTAGRYINGVGSPPKLQTLRLWALRCGVPLDWLRYGISEPDHNPSPDGTPTRGYSRHLTTLGHSDFTSRQSLAVAS